MKIVLTGATGLVGRALKEELFSRGHQVFCLSRQLNPGMILWNPQENKFPAIIFDDAQAVIHLAGEPIAAGLWTKKRKELIYDSRVSVTARFATFLANLKKPPRVFLSASAIGFYGNRGEEELDEESAGGHSFLADLCQAWEKAAFPLSSVGTRLLQARFGIVLARKGGALDVLKKVFRYGLGGPLGEGNQFMSWVALHDAVKAIVFAFENDFLEGPFNVTSPSPVTNKEFSMTLARVLKKPCIFKAPGWLLKRLPGHMGDDFFLASQRVMPRVLLKNGFRFEFPRLTDALARSISGALIKGVNL